MIKNKDMLFKDFPKFQAITEQVKKDNDKRIFTGGVRINNGMYRTDDQLNEYKMKSLQRRMP